MRPWRKFGRFVDFSGVDGVGLCDPSYNLDMEVA